MFLNILNTHLLPIAVTLNSPVQQSPNFIIYFMTLVTSLLHAEQRIYMVDGIYQDWKRNISMIILKWVNIGMKINDLKLNNYACLAFIPGQKFDPINVNTWPQAMICLYLKSVVFAMTTSKARASPWLRKYIPKYKRFFLCLSLYQKALHQLTFNRIPPGFYPKFWWLQGKRPCILSIFLSDFVSLFSFISGLSWYISTCCAIQIIVEWTVTCYILQLSR